MKRIDSDNGIKFQRNKLSIISKENNFIPQIQLFDYRKKPNNKNIIHSDLPSMLPPSFFIRLCISIQI